MVIPQSCEPFLALVQPDAILPEQLRPSSPAALVPERRLMVAVVAEAITCFQKYCGARSTRGRRFFREAETWLMYEPQGAPFSFERICEVVGFDANYVRQGLRRWQAERVMQPGADNGTAESATPHLSAAAR